MDTQHVKEVVRGCFDLGCWTVCNGTGWNPPPATPDWNGIILITLFLCLILLLLLCLYSMYIIRARKYFSTPPFNDLPTPLASPFFPRSHPPSPPTTPTRGRVSAIVEVHTPTGIKTMQMKMATHTPLSNIKDGIPSVFPDSNLKEDDLPRCRLFYDDEEEELDENKSLREMNRDEEGITLKLKMATET